MHNLNVITNALQLSPNQIRIIKYMLNDSDKFEISLDYMDILTLLSYGHRVEIVQTNNIEEIIKNKELYENAMGCCILMESNESNQLNGMTQCLELANQLVHKDGETIYAWKSDINLKDIRFTFLFTGMPKN